MKQFKYKHLFTPNYGKIDKYEGLKMEEIDLINNTCINNFDEWIIELGFYDDIRYIDRFIGRELFHKFYVIIVTNYGNIYEYGCVTKPNSTQNNNEMVFTLINKTLYNTKMTDFDIEQIKIYPMKHIDPEQYDYTNGPHYITYNHQRLSNHLLTKQFYNDALKYYKSYIENMYKSISKQIPQKECYECNNQISKIIALIPCGHTQLCHSCINKTKICPQCKSQINNTLPIYL